MNHPTKKELIIMAKNEIKAWQRFLNRLTSNKVPKDDIGEEFNKLLKK